jgi:L-rhamnonate dehydratase
MKITEVRTRVVQWEGETVPLPPHFCTNPMDLVAFRQASMGNFAFHGWVLVEIFTDTGLVGLGNAALSPVVTKALIDTPGIRNISGSKCIAARWPLDAKGWR